ncbi:AmmeMemoRadiSam system radical SAM enzyme, partial [bacterium]|nr:AmmeMemoRadiSam system radical SAM enzyme [bacterium]
EAEFYRQLKDKTVQCRLCFRNCIIPEGKRGFCLARENREGKLYTLTYGKPVAIHIDPIEKEPLFHMEPGSNTLCVGTATCDLRCKNCINWHIAHKAPEELEAIPMTPADVLQTAIDRDIHTICFTYNEPTQQYEFIYDIAKIAKQEGLRITLHSNGEINSEPMEAILPYIDSAAIDLKAFNEEIYLKLTAGKLTPVLDTLKLIKKSGVWVEVIYLIIPTWNDDFEDIERMCVWIRNNLGEETPLHFSRFFPAYKLNSLSPTPISTLERAHAIAKESGLHYVYIGNVSGHAYANTYCPSCAKLLIERKGLLVQQNNITDGRCSFCGHEIPGIWEKRR